MEANTPESARQSFRLDSHTVAPVKSNEAMKAFSVALKCHCVYLDLK